MFSTPSSQWDPPRPHQLLAIPQPLWYSAATILELLLNEGNVVPVEWAFRFISPSCMTVLYSEGGHVIITFDTVLSFLSYNLVLYMYTFKIPSK
jgi:hypothetical protein